jgi:hypothetical protein
MATHSSINIALSADTSGLNKNIKEAAKTVEQGGQRMQEAARQAGEAMANALGNMSVRDAIKEVSQAIDEQKAITLGYQKDLQGLRDKSAQMSAADIKGQRALRKEIEAVKVAIAGQKLGIADLTAEKKLLQAELAKETMATKESAKATAEANKATQANKTINSATRASLNGLATSFSSVSSIIAIVADDNKALRQTLMATNAALNFSAAVMQVRDLSKEYGGLGKAAKDVKKFITANPYLVAAAAVTAITIAVAAYSKEVNKVSADEKNLNDIQSETNKNFQEEAKSVAALLAIVNSQAASMKSRKEALSEIQKIYPNYLKNQDLEKVSTDTLSNATTNLTAEILKNARARAASAKLQELQGKLLDIESEKDKRKINTLKEVSRLQSIGAGPSQVQGFQQSQEGLNKVLNITETSLRAQIDAVIRLATAENLNIVATTQSTAAINEKKTAIKSLNKETDLLIAKNTGTSLLAPVDPIVPESMDEVLRKLDEIPAALEDVKTPPLFTDVVEDAPALIGTTVEISDAFKLMADRNSESFQKNASALNADTIRTAEWAAKKQVALDQINAAFANLQMQTAANVGQFIADLATGEEDAAKNFGKNMLGAIAGFMDTLGKAIIATAIATEAFQKLIVANPAAAAVAGLALIAGAAVVRNTLKEGPNVTAFADGGIVSGPTLGLMGEYPNASRNPEVIAPLDKLTSLIQPQGSGFVASTSIQGRDLAIVLERYNKDTKRG